MYFKLADIKLLAEIWSSKIEISKLVPYSHHIITSIKT